MFYFLDTKANESDYIVKETINAIYVYNEENKKIIYIKLNNETLKKYFSNLFENSEILKCRKQFKKRLVFTQAESN